MLTKNVLGEIRTTNPDELFGDPVCLDCGAYAYEGDETHSCDADPNPTKLVWSVERNGWLGRLALAQIPVPRKPDGEVDWREVRFTILFMLEPHRMGDGDAI